MGRPSIVIVNKVMSDEESKQLEGQWIDESFLKIPVIRENTDVYYMEKGERKLLLKFRRNCISSPLIR